MKRDEEDDDDGKVIRGRWFAESFEVGHNSLEFKVDCGQDENGEAQTVYFRVIASPANARELFRLLGRSLLQYADEYGSNDARGSRGRK